MDDDDQEHLDSDEQARRYFERRMFDALMALKQVDEYDIPSIKFNPRNQTSIRTAIRTINNKIDYWLEEHLSDPKIALIIQGAKDRYRQEILDIAEEARSTNEEVGKPAPRRGALG